jgi:hypothetical protein
MGSNGSTDEMQTLTRQQQALLAEVGRKLVHAGLTPRVLTEHIELLPDTPNVMIIRVMADGDYEPRVHLRSIAANGAETEVSSEKPRNVFKLVKRATVFVAAAQRTHDSEGKPL